MILPRRLVLLAALFPALLLLQGCNGTTVGLGAAALGAWATKPGEPQPADTASQIAQHESWCYSTLGDPECYAHPQNVEPESLINVDPQNRYPLTRRQYYEALLSERY